MFFESYLIGRIHVVSLSLSVRERMYGGGCGVGGQRAMFDDEFMYVNNNNVRVDVFLVVVVFNLNTKCTRLGLI